ncbi:hypothetical protein HB810_12080 [Listeria booriae]|nr:hypothetical protein [Listeria booriae]
MTYAWDTVENATAYRLYLGEETTPSVVATNQMTIQALHPMTNYSARVTAVDGRFEGEKSEVITHMTSIAVPTLKTPHIDGITYLLGETVNDPNVTAFAVFKEDGTWYKNGTITNGAIKFYATANLVAGQKYIGRVVYGKSGSGTEILGMPLEFECIKARITINPVTTTERVVAGTSEAGLQVRTWQNGVARTTVPVDTAGHYTSSLSSVAVGDVIKAEVKIGTTYATTAEWTVRE